MGLNKKKGFFLTLAVLVILSFMIISISLWNVVVSTKEEKEPVIFQAESLQELAKSFNSDKISRIAHIIDYRAMYDLDWEVRHSGVYVKNVSSAMEEFVLYGRCYPHDVGQRGVPDIDPPTFVHLAAGCYNIPPSSWSPGKSCLQFDLNGDGSVGNDDLACLSSTNTNGSEDTFYYWQGTIKSLAEQAGFNVSAGIENFSANQTDPWNVSVSYLIVMNITNNDGTMEIKKDIQVSDNFSIGGLEDPLIGVESWKSGEVSVPGAEKQIFIGAPYASFVTQIPASAVARGEGWDYGTVAPLDKDINPNESDRIYVGDYPPADTSPYSAFILVKSPEIVANVGGTASATCKYAYTEPCKDNSSNTCSGTFGTTKSCTYYNMNENTSECFDCYSWTPGCGITCDPVPPQQSIPPNIIEPGLVITLTSPTSVVAQAKSPAALIKSGGSGGKPYIQYSDRQASFIPSGTFQDRFLFVFADPNWAVGNTVDNSSIDQYTGGSDGQPPVQDTFTKLLNNGIVKFYDIENLRDYGVCSSYRTYTGAPSFFARLRGIKNVVYDPNGIESFIVGQWAAKDGLSRVDWEYYSNMSGTVVRGMPGCKNDQDCTSNVPVGHFALSSNALTRYNANEIACPPAGFGAKCD